MAATDAEKTEKVADLTHEELQVPLDAVPKSRWERSWPVIACGAGLFSDGYLNGVIGSVNTMLSRIYPDSYKNSPALRNVSSLVFVGEVVGMLFFGITSDYWSRKWSLMASTVLVILFAALSAGSYGANGSPTGLFAALTAYRFLMGIGIGGEYPAGSVAAAESTGELKEGHRNRWFIFFTDLIIDFGFVVAAFVPMVLILIFGEDRLEAPWRIALGLGVLPPLSLVYLRLKLQEPEEFNQERMHRFPYGLIIKYHWKNLLVVSLVWFIYDFSVFAFGTYSSVWLANILGTSAPLWQTFGWNVVVNLFYLPGSLLGAFVSDWIGPRMCLILGMTAQAVVGFIMSGCYEFLSLPKNVAGFVVVYGIFLSLGELGPGDNIGLIASKSSATAVRGQYYAIAAAIGKIGAFVGTYMFPLLQDNPNPIAAGQNPFFVASSLCIFASVITYFGLPHIGQDTITKHDREFREYLGAHGYDTSTLGQRTEGI
ncbi:Glycerophosphodiester transporter GIT2 [Penicillium canescens]|uniref:Glycerophosphodiester transporter GIT2 n=1 Tax=Penicillium canescens TaxID=5083 RepID=A0AAD6IA41_PENCN|nr:Glycerophosphodiester transporter GIT2 [Penicillium canescens]KAJ6019995.1 Glycerophosphodiester transporter GIT2 [Penicillium canescens]KAJ6037926.1 Glycerophosphodiester transporter GIT2 [Penicillium canescens]KAJ6045339.1 Glycerophosphodiester transporter GIT2 [Penicillium canescens]KAJ6061040.1 Glycerophosphodiester transporter GIT2 [Penicillium canescens]KAJ6088840.1 Glycerophosphodiester transporter GIT2 [Penicillium canescens]